MTEQIRFFDLFGGIGGFRLGLERASNRYRCVGYSDKDKYAVKSYNEIFGESHEPSDISEVEPKQLPDFDLLCGGFPCQAFSIAGNREGFEDTRGTLFFEICRIARAKRPSVLLLENVKGLLSHNEGETFRTILSSLDELGYDAEWQVLNSKHWGVPQNRERVLIIASLRERPGRQVFPVGREDGEDSGENGRQEGIGQIKYGEHDQDQLYLPSGLSSTVRGEGNAGHHLKVARGLNTAESGEKEIDVLGNVNPSGKGMNGDVYRASDDTVAPTVTTNKGEGHKIINHQMRPESRPSIQEEGQSGGSGILFNSEYSYALSSSPHFVSGQNIQGVSQGTRIRKLTPRECWRLQGFPDWAFDRAEQVNSDTQLYKQAGNAVTVNVVEKLGNQLLDKVFVRE